MEIALLNGHYSPLTELSPAWLNYGTFFGDGVYEVIRSYDNKIFALEDHLVRLKNSLNALDITADVDIIRQQVTSSFQRSGIENAKIYIQITRGCGPRDHFLPDNIRPDVLIIVSELPDARDQKENGIAVISYPDLRWKRCDIKSLNLLPNVMASRAAKKKKCTEAIFVNDNDEITEGASSSFFAVQDGKIYVTPLKNNILPSISRKYILKAAGELDIEIVQEQFSLKDINKAEELFIGATTRDVVGIVKFDGIVISDGKVGEITRKIEKQFQNYSYPD